MSFTNDDVLQILALLDASGFDELRVETSDFKLHLRRSVPTNGAAASHVETPSPFVSPPVSNAAPSSASAHSAATSEAAKPIAPAAASDLVDVKAPLLGTFYGAPQPGAPAFVAIGATVAPDTVIGIVEVMKLMNSVCAGTDGVVAEVVAKDGELVEYGAVLMRIARSGA
jgi:acetyl-CoA carboxylase biotin carboxyl carrier protein